MGLISGTRNLVIDAWSWLNFKPVFSDTLGMPHRRAFPEAAASWVPAADERRLAAYKLLVAYDNNQAGELAAFRDGDDARERREFGDPSMFVDTLVAHVMGREQHIVVPGADQTTGDDGPAAAAAQAARVQELLRQWAEDELLPMRMLQTERKAVLLGDGVYLLCWDPAKRRARLRTYDPGFYYPVLPADGDAADFPDRIHLAWDLPEDKQRGLKPRLRRITYELDWIRPRTASGVDRTGRPVRAPVMTDPGDDDTPSGPVLGLGDQVDEAGGIWRMYPWNDEPAYRTCYLTDATWDLGDLKGPHDVDSLPMDKAQYATGPDGEVLDRLDLYLDFIPLIHIPNTVPPAEEHWGQSSLAKALQVFDELAGTDTDSSKASATTGSPMIFLSGKSTGRREQQVGPGVMVELGEGGRADALNTAPQLAELREHRHDLAEQAANVVRLPAVSLGTMDPSKVPSGYALELSLGPLDSLISHMRLARGHKYALLLKFVQRLHLAGQHPDWVGTPPLPALPARLEFGPYAPTDQAAVLDQVATAYKEGLISLETGVRMLTSAGWPIDDAEAEIELIESRSFEQARLLADALGNPDEVAAFLRREAPAEPETPTVQLPALPGAGLLPAGDEDDDGDDPEGSRGTR
ncbi:hypothetical protein [Streptomyces sp. DH12]|uniref:hypothetical protein n=1 Tax=Streptomyces sp. DH12 TaxID=2857010 RepID=UPI001E285DDF|nr:hypothetical protein [Streptomyces sp. DH12]